MSTSKRTKGKAPSPERKSVSPLKRLNESRSPLKDRDKAPGPDDFIKCDLCKQTLDEPKTLSCMHSYCRDCLMTYIMETVGDNGKAKNVIVCPVCLQHTAAPKADEPPEKWADYLPTNSFISGYLEAASLKDPNKKCDTCRRQNKRSEAGKWCNVCHDALCTECVGFHNALKTTKGHSLIPLSSIRNQSIDAIMTSPLCKFHKSDTVSKYCEQHEAIVCEKCVAEKHKDCRQVVPLKEAATKRQNEMFKTKEILAEEASLSQAIYEDRVKTDKDMDETQLVITAKIQEVRKKINENLSRCEAEMIEQLREYVAKEKSDMQTEMKEAQRIRKSSGKVHSLASNTATLGVDSHKLESVDDTSRQSAHYKDKLSSLNGRLKHTKIDFIVDGTLGKLIGGIGKLGELRVTKTRAELPTSQSMQMLRSNSDPEDEPNARGSIRHSKNKTESKKTKAVNLKATLAGTVDGHSPKDTESSWITGIAYMSDGKIILVDRNNNKLKIMQGMKITAEIGLQHQPFGITVVSAQEVAVTFPRENQIAIFGVSSTLTQTNTIQTSERCYGISYANSNFAVTCACSSPPSLKIITRAGRELHDLSPEDNFHPMFFRPWYIKMDPTGSDMYISDCNRSHLTCISGTVMKRYKFENSGMNSPRGLHVTKDGRVLLCGFGSDCIQMIDKEGALIGTLLSRADDVIGPQDVALNPSEDTMIVTLDPSSGKSNTIKIFKVSL